MSARAVHRYARGARRRGGVATQRPAKPSIPVRFRSSPLRSTANRGRSLAVPVAQVPLGRMCPSPRYPSAESSTYSGRGIRLHPCTVGQPGLASSPCCHCSRQEATTNSRRCHSTAADQDRQHRGDDLALHTSCWLLLSPREPLYESSLGADATHVSQPSPWSRRFRTLRIGQEEGGRRHFMTRRFSERPASHGVR